MSKTKFSDWKLLLGEVEISDGEDIYQLQVGYIDGIFLDHPKELYLRIWRKNDENFLQGAWITAFPVGRYVSEKLQQICFNTANRLKKLKAFA